MDKTVLFKWIGTFIFLILLLLLLLYNILQLENN